MRRLFFLFQGTVSLDDLLLHYIGAETVSNVECPGCGKVKLRSKETAKLPLPRSTFKKKLTIGKVCVSSYMKLLITVNFNAFTVRSYFN